MKKSFLILFSMFIASLANAGPESFEVGRPEVRFDREIEVSERETYHWSDLVQVKNADEGFLRRLRETPWKGMEAVRAQVRDWRISENPARQTLFHIPTKVNLKKVKGYSREEFRRKLLNRLVSQCRECRFEILQIRDNTVSLSGEWNLDESAIKPVGQLLIPLQTTGKSLWVPVQLRVSRKAVVLKRSISMGQVITPDDVEIREVDVSHGRETPLRLEDLKDVAAARPLGAGHILLPSDVKKEELVKRGQVVKIITGSSDFEVSVTALAEQPGRFGDVVRLKNLESGKIISGVVTGPGEVRMQ